VVPKHILDEAVYISHHITDGPMLSHELARYAGVFEALRQYSCTTKVLVTSRLHAAMPAAAMGTPTILIDDPASLPGGGGDSGELRLAGLENVVHVLRPDAAGEWTQAFNWHDPPPNPEADLRRAKAHFSKLTLACADVNYLDAGIKFGAMEPTFADLAAGDTPPCKAGAANSTQEAIHITTGADSNFLAMRNGVAIATWAKALGRSNPDQKIVLYVLTDGLSTAQQCLVRALMRRNLAAGSIVHTISVEGALAQQEGTAETHLLKHVSRVTMVRLLLPKLLPCVQKTLWIDLDALVVAPLAPLFAIQPAAPCGIAGRQSVVEHYLGRYQGPDKEVIAPTLENLVTFNAGVVIMDLDILRNDSAYERTVQKIAFDYGNDDQVTLNMWCQGAYTKLDPKWNVFNNMGGLDTTLELGEALWGIVHYAGSLKPWSTPPFFANPGTRAVWLKFAEDYWGEEAPFYNTSNTGS